MSITLSRRLRDLEATRAATDAGDVVVLIAAHGDDMPVCAIVPERCGRPARHLVPLPGETADQFKARARR